MPCLTTAPQSIRATTRSLAEHAKNHVTVDIGAYEVQQEDIVFNTGFEGCP
jgi:hypothetical protein